MRAWEFSCEIMGHPPGVNNLYFNAHGKRVKSAQYRRYEQLVALTPFQGRRCDSKGLYECLVEVYGDWFCKNGQVCTKDIDGMLKALLDCVCRKAGIDDSRIFRLEVVKLDGASRDRTRVFLRSLERATP